ncbi:MAG TPA: SpoIID/LytB domain-containing protein [Solirubrobacteraceae bacterium]|jgi:stage II sporulation protein D|nr:SpoIID/LytB domain-containing protein [Solirubrobacteraceae bacterium]
MRALLLSAAMLAAAPATASAADIVIDGRGWGHGIGMSQYGAYGYALREGRDHRFILGHYYSGTTLGDAPGTRMRVLLQVSGGPRVSGATVARGGGRRVRLSSRRTYRFTPIRGGRLSLTDVRTGRRRARLRGPVTVTGGTTTRLRGLAQNGVSEGRYRGRVVLSRSGSSVLAVNSVGLEQYLYGVVPAEMPASWPSEALKAQAIVARSYALTSRAPGLAYDVYADVRSQVYRGVTGEIMSTTEAVRATKGRVVLAVGQIAQTFFFSTSGGRTAGNEEEWGGTPYSYLRPVDDPHDDLSPYHTWRARFSRAQVAGALRDYTRGRFRRLRIRSRTTSGRVATLTVVGRRGSTVVSGATVRARLGLRSNWITRISGP